MAADQLEEHLRRGVLGEEDRGGAHREREEEVAARGVAEEELGHRKGHVRLAVPEGGLGIELGGVGVRAVRLEDGLGPARCASREEPEAGVVAVGGDVLETVRRARGFPGPRGLARGVGTSVVAHDEEPLEPARLGGGRGPGLETILVDHRQASSGVVEEVRDLVGLEAGVRHHCRRPRLERPEERADVLGHVRQRYQHPLLRLQAQGSIDVREAIGQGLDVAVEEPLVAGHERDPVALPLADPRIQEVVGDVEDLRRLVAHGPSL